MLKKLLLSKQKLKRSKQLKLQRRLRRPRSSRQKTRRSQRRLRRRQKQRSSRRKQHMPNRLISWPKSSSNSQSHSTRSTLRLQFRWEKRSSPLDSKSQSSQCIPPPSTRSPSLSPRLQTMTTQSSSSRLFQSLSRTWIMTLLTTQLLKTSRKQPMSARTTCPKDTRSNGLIQKTTETKNSLRNENEKKLVIRDKDRINKLNN